jgi:ketosteroid isomerase-like protein
MMTPADTVRALYAAISYPAGARPDFARLRELFLPNARLGVPHPHDREGIYWEDVEAWIADFERQLEGAAFGFREEELSSRELVYRDMAHVFSSYVAYISTMPDPMMRGLNSVQLMREPSGVWRVATIVWDIETPEAPLPF